MMKNFLLCICLSLTISTAKAMEEEHSPLSPTYRPVFRQGFSMQDLGRCAQVSRQWNEHSADNFFWDPIAQDYGNFHGFPTTLDFSRIPKKWKDMMHRTLTHRIAPHSLVTPTLTYKRVENFKKRQEIDPKFKPTALDIISNSRIVL